MNSSVSYVRMCVRKAIWGLGLALAVLVLCQPAFSQLSLGNINGTVTSAAGGPVADAAVSVIDISRGDTRPLMTDTAGLYSAVGLTPGPYTVRVMAKGFKTMIHSGINLGVGSTLQVDFTLQPGAESEQVTITTEVLPANANAVVENKAVTETPTNGRSFVALVEGRNTGQTTLPGSGGNARATNGMRTDQNNPMIDGVYNGDIDTGWQIVNGFGFQGGIDPDVILPLDSIQEINNNAYPKAEFGGKAAGMSNLGIKSGTNAFHGTLYAFGRDADTNTRNPFRPPPGSPLAGAGKSPYAMEQFGASAGGTLKKDKIFYFLNYERQRYNVGSTVSINEPTTASGLGATNSIPDAIFNMIHTGGVNPTQLSLNLAGCGALTPAGAAAAASAAVIATSCNSNLGIFNNSSTTSQNFAFGVPSIGGPDAGVFKMDYRINNKNSVNGEYYIGSASSEGWTKFSSEPWWVINSRIQIQVVRGVWIYTPTSTLANEARFGMDLVHETTLNSDCQGINGAPNYINTFGFDTGSPTTVSGPSGCAFPFTTITGFTSQNVSPGAGPYTSEPRNYVGIDSLSWTHGKHVFKFGIELDRGVFTGSGGGGTGPPLKGTLTFGTTAAFTGATPLQDFLAGTQTLGTIFVQPGAGTGVVTGVTSQIQVQYYAGFIQDTYRVNRNLTLDYGIRYEYQSPYTQNANQQGFLNTGIQPSIGATPVNCVITGVCGSGLGQMTGEKAIYYQDTWKHNFAPRTALAWDVKGNGKTVVRLAGNITYAQPSYSGLSGPQNVPTGATFVNPSGSTFQNLGQNTITNGVIQQPGGLPWNNCMSGCTSAQTIFGSLAQSSTIFCGNNQKAGSGGVFTGALNPATCSIQVTNPNLYTPYVTSWAVNLQQTLSKSVSMVLGYVGNHGTAIRGIGDINQPAPGQKNATTSVNGTSAEQDRRPFTTNCPTGSTPGAAGGVNGTGPCFPWLGQVLMVSNSDVSNFDALQWSMTLRNYHGLGGALNFAWQHCLDEFSSNENIWTVASNSLNPQQDYATCTTGSPLRLTGNFNYAVPPIKAPAQLLKGWAVNGVVNWLPERYSGLKDTSSDTSGTGNLQDSWNIVGSPRNINGYGLGSNLSTIPCYGATGSSFAKAGCATSSAGSVGPGGICSTDAALQPSGPGGATATAQLNTLGCYVDNGTVLLPPAQGTFGDMSRNCCLQPGFLQVDMSVTKTFGFLKEQRLKAQFRAEIFNVINRVNYAAAASNLGSVTTLGQFNNTVNQGAQIVTGTGGEREVQFGLKLIW